MVCVCSQKNTMTKTNLEEKLVEKIDVLVSEEDEGMDWSDDSNDEELTEDDNDWNKDEEESDDDQEGFESTEAEEVGWDEEED